MQVFLILQECNRQVVASHVVVFPDVSFHLVVKYADIICMEDLFELICEVKDFCDKS